MLKRLNPRLEPHVLGSPPQVFPELRRLHRLATGLLEVVERQLQLIVLYVVSIRLEQCPYLLAAEEQRNSTLETLPRSAPRGLQLVPIHCDGSVAEQRGPPSSGSYLAAGRLGQAA